MRFVRPRQPRDLDDTLIPLINVVFLMLIFFMIAGRISTPDGLRIDPPASAQGQLIPPAEAVLLMDAGGRVAMNGQPLSLTELDARLATWMAAQRESGPDASQSPPSVTLKADAAVRHAQLRQLLGRLRAAGVERVRLLVEPPAD